MKKEEVELIIVGVNLGSEEALYMKIYKDGTLIRKGCGSLPPISISGYTMEGDTKYWNELFPLIDEQIVAQPIMYQDEKITTPLEYFIAFFGASDNGQTGEHAKWTKTSGMRFVLDNNTSFNHPLLHFLDQFVIKAAEVTNEWFFDIIMNGVYNLKPVGLAPSFITMPKTDAEKQEALQNYVNQMLAMEARGWDIVKIGTGRKYESPDGKVLTADVKKNGNSVSINFFGSIDMSDPDAIDQLPDHPLMRDNASRQEGKEQRTSTKKWWKFWEWVIVP